MIIDDDLPATLRWLESIAERGLTHRDKWHAERILDAVQRGESIHDSHYLWLEEHVQKSGWKRERHAAYVLMSAEIRSGKGSG